jgi:CRP/FNR family transcriptional regulator
MATSAQRQTDVPPTGIRRRHVPPLRPVETLNRRAPAPGPRPLATPFRPASPLDWRQEDLVAEDVYMRKGGVLLCRGAPFTTLYVVRSGSCKSAITTREGDEQIAAFHIAGEILGIEAIGEGSYGATITALEDSEFRAMPLDRFLALAQENNDVQGMLCAALSQEIRRARTVSLWLATMRSEQRLACFLLDLADRYCARGYSSCELMLRMSRQEIGLHLGLSHETVSRLLSSFHRQSLVRVRGRLLTIIDREALQAL